MSVTIISCIMAILWSSVLVLFAFLLRRRQFFIKSFGVVFLLAIYFGIILRAVLPVELFFTKVLSSPLYNNFYSAIWAQYPIGGLSISGFAVLLLIWATVSIVLILLWIFRYLKEIGEIKKADKYDSEKLKETLFRIVGKRSNKISIYRSKKISVPMAAGLLRPMIILPDKQYSESDIELIILHEYTHLINHDLWVKLLMLILCCVFWWNPLMYLLRMDLNSVLEIKCDLVVTGEMNNKEKAEYLSVIRRILSENIDDGDDMYDNRVITAEFVNRKHKSFTEERFTIVANYKKETKKERFFNIIVAVVLTITLLFSYSFILQPKYEPPIEEVENVEGNYTFTKEDAYIKKESDGTYTLVLADGSKSTIEEEGARMLEASGFEIIE